MCIICNLIGRLCCKKCMCNAECPDANFEIGDHPIISQADDTFKIQERVVNKVYQDLAEIHGQITIAITGEWGVGKTSAMNLLQNMLVDANKKNIIIKFGPQVEGKLEISELIGAFYLKLYQQVSNKKIKNYVVKCLKGLAALTNIGIKGNVGVTGVFNFGFTYSTEKGINALIKRFEKNKPEEFSLQAVELNKLLWEEKIKVYVFIDEIDRLPEPYIINFLLFCRTLEAFNNLICIVGVDYEQALNKLMNEKLGSHLQNDTDRYRGAKNYLDKLFQIKYQVHHDIYTLHSYTLNQISCIDTENILSEIFDVEDYKKCENILGLISFLATPRRIKKWLILLKLNYFLIKNARDNKFELIAFLAVAIKHPIITDNLSKYTPTFIRNKCITYININKQYGSSFTEMDNDSLMLAYLGVIGWDGKRNNDEKLMSLIKKIGVQYIDDQEAVPYVSNFLKMPTFLVLLFVLGVTDPSQVTLLSDYFGGRIDLALKALLRDDAMTNLLAKDLAEILHKGGVGAIDNPVLDNVNELWTQKIDSNDVLNYYDIIIRMALRNLSIEDVISGCPLGLSESYLNEILYVCGVENKDGKYDLDASKAPQEEVINKKFLGATTFENKLIQSFSDGDVSLKAMLIRWLNKADDNFKSLNVGVFNQKSIISVFYRYIQWGRSATAGDNRGKLTAFVMAYLQDININDNDKVLLKKYLNNEIEKTAKGGFLGRGNAMADLFGNGAQGIVSLLS